MKDVIIIGAGPAGLSAARVLKEKNISSVVLEKEPSLGGVYARRGFDFTVITPARLSGLPGKPLSSSHGSHMKRSEFCEYLESYAKLFSLPVVCDEKVIAVEKNKDGYFVVKTEKETYEAKAVLVASGQGSFPTRPHIHFEKEGEVEMIDGIRYVSKEASGVRALVVGAGNTGAEIALDLYNKGATVFLSAKRKPRAIRLTIFGINFQYFIGVAEYVACFIPRFMRVGLLHHKKTPLVYPELTKLIREKKIVLFPPALKVEGKKVFFENGEVCEVDVIYNAIGFWYNTNFLRTLGDDIKIGCGDSSVPGLFFIGFPNECGPASSFLRGIAWDAPKIAKKIAAYVEKKK